jgi:dolichol-phosphate mannosyltransferase
MSISVIVPTFNEAGNVAELVSRVSAVAVAADVREIVFVDDSTDNTPSVIREVAAEASLPVRVIHRKPGRRTGGLSGAVVAGIRNTTGEWLLVMDGDLQHPPEDLPRLARAARCADIVVASRYREGGDASGLSSVARRVMSTGATQLARSTFPVRLRRCSDPMTGFFAVRRQALDVGSLRPDGFKILLEILARHRMRVVEVPFTFADRFSGGSKASLLQGLRYVNQLARLRLDMWRAELRNSGQPWGQRARFGAVGLLNLIVDVGLFNLLLVTTAKPLTAKLFASGVAVASSYVLNRRWTWRTRSTTGTGVALPAFVCVALLGVAIAEACLFASHYLLGLTSPLADNVSANVVGLGLGIVVRYRLCDTWVFRDRGASNEGEDIVDLAPVPLQVGAPARVA